MNKIIEKILSFFTNKKNVKVDNIKENKSLEEKVFSFDYYMNDGMNYLKQSEEYFENKDYEKILSLNKYAIISFEKAQKMTTDSKEIIMIQGFIDDTKDKNITLAIMIQMEEPKKD